MDAGGAGRSPFGRLRPTPRACRTHRVGRKPKLECPMPRRVTSDNARSMPLYAGPVAFGLDEREQAPWLAAWERVSTGNLRRPAGAVRVREARPRLLGVHACIQVDRATTDLPVYVPRDLDVDLRTAITAAEGGGFVLL